MLRRAGFHCIISSAAFNLQPWDVSLTFDYIQPAVKCYLKLYCRNPKISSEEMKRRMQDYDMIRIKNLASKVKTGAGNWVTIGVVVDKLPPRSVLILTVQCGYL